MTREQYNREIAPLVSQYDYDNIDPELVGHEAIGHYAEWYLALYELFLDYTPSTIDTIESYMDAQIEQSAPQDVYAWYCIMETSPYFKGLRRPRIIHTRI